MAKPRSSRKAHERLSFLSGFECALCDQCDQGIKIHDAQILALERLNWQAFACSLTTVAAAAATVAGRKVAPKVVPNAPAVSQ